MATMTATAVTIKLEAACLDQGCADLAFRFKKQLAVPNYSEGASVLPMPVIFGAWRDQHRTARKRANRAARLGYQFEDIDRSQFNDDIHEINTSLDERQGRSMTDGYLTRHNYEPLPEYVCDRHRVHTYGVLEGARLRAYLTLYRCGDLGLVSTILGHGDHLDAGIMYLLMAGVVADQVRHGGALFYNRFDSGEDGLRFYKTRTGFVPMDIEWLL